MNFQEVQSYLKAFYSKNSNEVYSSLPMPLGYDKWHETKEAIEPHFYGKMPKAIKDAFYNETKEQFEYRKKVYKNRTKEKLWSAIDDVKRLTMGEKMQIQVDAELYNELRLPKNFGSEFSVESYFFNVVYPYRVLDPNAVLAVCPDQYGEDMQNERVAIKYKIYKSKSIVFESDEAVIIQDEVDKDRYYVFTKTSYIVAVTAEDKKSMILVSEYVHNNQNKGVFKLQGRNMSATAESGKAYSYYDSDFSHAVSAMDDSEILSNQLKVVTANAAFPTRIIKGLECDSCKGKGKIQKRDEFGQFCWLDAHMHIPEMETCKSCNGRGTLPIGALDQIVVPDNAGFGAEQKSDNLATSYLAYVNPDVSSIVEVRNQKTLAAGEVDEVLNITKPAKFAESGVAKEKDREGKYTFLKNIASTFSRLIQNVLHASIDYLFTVESDAAKAQMKENTYVIEPISFDIRTASEVESEYFANIDQKPLTFRKEQYLDVLRKRFGDDAQAVLVAETAIEYTKGFMLRTMTELQTLYSLNIISREQFYIATIIDTVVDSVYRELESSFVDRAEVFSAIDRAVSSELASLAPLPPPAPTL